MKRYNIPKWIIYTLVVIIIAVIQLQTASYPRFFNVTPLFLIPAIIAISMVEDEMVGAIYGLVGGLLWDTTTGNVFGFNALFLMIMGVAAGLVVKLLFKNRVVISILIVAVFTFIHEFLTWFFFWYLESKGSFSYAMLKIILPTVLMTAIFAIPINILFRFMNKKTVRNEKTLGE